MLEHHSRKPHRAAPWLKAAGSGMDEPWPGHMGGGPFIRRIVLSVGLLLLIWEWLRPLPELSQYVDIYRIQPFVVAISCFLAVGCFRLKWRTVCLADGLVSFAVVGVIFQQESGLAPSAWLTDYFSRLFQEAAQIFAGGGAALSPETRTLLLFIGWAMLVTAVQFLVLYRQYMIPFLAVTLLYLLSLQLWHGLDTTSGVVRAAAVGLVMLALLALPRLERTFGLRASLAGWPKLWLAASGCLVVVLIASAYGLARTSASGPLDPIRWTDVPLLRQAALSWIEYAKSASDRSGPSLHGAALSGYGFDDRRLGGPLQLNDSVVFKAKSERPTYWRGESKSFYDGKGWRNPPPVWTEAALSGPLPPALYEDSAAVDIIKQEITLTEPDEALPLLAGGAVRSVDSILFSHRLSDEVKLLVDRYSGIYRLNEAGTEAGAVSYLLETAVLHRDESVLRAAEGEDPEAVLREALQLPDSFPERVVRLAQTIVAGDETRYGKAKAIEQYLRQNFAYSIDNVKAPPADQDFVDHFLFTLKQGYCVHFSTAMTTMLRAVGVPARWVKGFAQGEVLDHDQTEANVRSEPSSLSEKPAARGEEREYVVRARHAHAWVEVYFPGIGWVPFEPTPGFSGAASAAVPSALDETAHSLPPVQDDIGPAVDETAVRPEGTGVVQEGKSKDNGFPLARVWQTVKKGAAAVLTIAAVIAAAAWTIRRLGPGCRARYLLCRYERSRGNRRLLQRIVEHYRQYAVRRLGRAEASDTMREYAARFKDREPVYRDLSELALIFERAYYGAADVSTVSPRQLRRLWKRLRHMKPSTAE
jgi:transglutaminase-like putative cysteine protease